MFCIRFDFDEVLDESDSKEDREAKLNAISAQLVAKLHTILRPFLLRRLKSDVKNLEIPVKRQVVIYCPFTEAQKVFYDLVKLKDFEKFAQQKGNYLRNFSNSVHSFICIIQSYIIHFFLLTTYETYLLELLISIS